MQNKRSVGSRVYKMIADNGVVGTLKKLIERPTAGLEFLKRREKARPRCRDHCARHEIFARHL